MLRKRGALLLILLLVPMLTFAQGTGKLAGVVLDGSSGEGLPGASVIIVGTNLGVATDIDGNFSVIGVPVGTYEIQVSFVGYATQIVQGVEINPGYTRELNFELMPGVELDEVLVTYERPIIQKDAVGVPKIVTAEEIQNLPVRGPADLAKIQAGVVAKDGSDDLFVRGGRSSEVTYFIDGVKVTGSTGIPQSAIEQQEMLIGNINARYGDVMSGVINITTKSGSNEFFGSLEALTSEELDAFGYNILSATVGGPIIKNKVSFFLAAEYNNQDDSDPRSYGELFVPENVLSDLRANPISFIGQDANGANVYMPAPATLGDGARMVVDDAGLPVVNGGAMSFSDGTTVAVPEGVDPSSITLRPVTSASTLDPSLLEVRDAKRKRAYEDLSLSGNLTFNVLRNARLRVGGRLNTGTWDSGLNNQRVLFAPEMTSQTDRDDYQVFATWTQNVSNTTFFQIQADYSDYRDEEYDPRFGSGMANLMEYGNIDNAVFNTLRGYKDLGFFTEIRTDADGNEFEVQVPLYNNSYRDGSGPASGDGVIASLVQIPGGRFNDFEKRRNTQLRFSGSATTQIGLHQLEIGGEFEQRTQRYWGINAAALSRYAADGNPEQIAGDDANLNPNGYDSYSAIPAFILDDLVTWYGYDLRGNNEIDEENFSAFLNQDIGKPESDYNQAPYEPLYYGGYIQDKIEFNDIILNLGVRVDVFDNNTRVLKDRFSRRPVCQAGDIGSTVNGVDCGTPADRLPATIRDDFSVFYAGDNVVGYRDANGNFFDTDGEISNPGDILLAGQTRQVNGQITADMFEDYTPQVNFMPRIGVSFPVTDQALFFASYGVVTQRPSSRTFATLDVLQGTGGINNPNLKPERTTKYELGFRQRLGERSALTISGFFHQIENLIQLREIRGATPSVYSSYENVDFGTVKGLEFDFDLRRTSGVAAKLNYTLSFADGTGSGDRTTSTIVWVDETPPNFISPLDFDQRHRVNLTLDYRLGKGEGPMIGGIALFENFGVNVLATAASGFPYTAVVEPFNRAGGARAAQPAGGINSARMPGYSRIDVKVDRLFNVGGAGVTAFLWVQNVFNTTNTNDVWRYTGLPNDDGFLATPAGERYVNDNIALAETLYRHENRVLSWVGIPRLVRLGVRLDF